MSRSHAKPERESAKKHGDALEAAMRQEDAHSVQKEGHERATDPVPPTGDGGHSLSAAAHLKEGEEHSKPEGNLRQGSHAGALREPPMTVQRVGKQHRG